MLITQKSMIISNQQIKVENSVVLMWYGLLIG